MTFGPFLVRSPIGDQRIQTTDDALSYVRATGGRAIPHWRVAERMLEVAWMSADDAVAAEYAFREALMRDGLLIE